MNHWLQIWILPFAKLLVGLDPRLWFKLLCTPYWNYLYHTSFIINSLTVSKDSIGAVHFYSLGKALETLQLSNILPDVAYRQHSEWLCKLHPLSWDMQCDSVSPWSAHQSRAQQARWHWHGHASAQCHCTLLPPYSEGFPSLSPPPPLYKGSHTHTETKE